MIMRSDTKGCDKSGCENRWYCCQGPPGPQGPAGERGPRGLTGPQGETGQLLLILNGADLEYTVSGRATGTDQIIGIALVETTEINSVLTVRNPSGNASALTITPLAGGTRSVSAHLVITQIG